MIITLFHLVTTAHHGIPVHRIVEVVLHWGGRPLRPIR